MCFMKKFIVWLVAFACIFQPVYAQNFAPKTYMLDSFKNPVIVRDDVLLKLTPEEFHQHPEFGVLPYDSPCTDCYEMIHLRTDTTRHFVDRKDLTKVYTQTFLGLSAFRNDAGDLISLNPYLKLKQPNVYHAPQQETPIEIDFQNRETRFKIQGKEFVFNSNLEMIHLTESGLSISKGLANWSNYTVGSEGARIIDAWPGVDILFMLDVDKIKTTYEIKQNLGITTGDIVFIDRLDLPENYSMQLVDFAMDERTEKSVGTISISSESNDEVFSIGRAFGFDHSGIKENSTWFGYALNENSFELHVPTEWLNGQTMQYPLYVDPTVSSTSTFSAGWKSFRFNGSYCGGPNADCAYLLNAARPANSTLIGAELSATYQSLGGYCGFACWMNEAGFALQGPCGTDQWFSCAASAPGTCSGAGFNIAPTVVPCSAPACGGTIPFFILNSYCYCSLGGNCGDNCQWMPNNTWSITLIGRTLETLGNTATGNGYNAIVSSNCLGTSTLNPTPANGVPGYSYVWSTGETTPTINVSNATAGTTYTATITDACGVSRVATFDINCPLAVTLTDFNVIPNEQNVLLKWQTATERDHDYFVVQRTIDGLNFENIGTVKGVGNSSLTQSYSFTDHNPLPGVSYYRLEIVDIYGVKDYSSLESVNYSSDINTLSLVPNPANNVVMLLFTAHEIGIYQVTVYSLRGERVYDATLTLPKSNHHQNIDVSSLANGVYTVQLTAPTYVTSSKLVIQH